MRPAIPQFEIQSRVVPPTTRYPDDARIKCDTQILPNGTWTDNRHRATQNFMHLRQRLLSFWLVFSWSLYLAVVTWGKKKTNKHKEFWRDTPWCASRLSRGHVQSVPWYVPSVPGTFWPFSIDLHINQSQMSQVSLGRPEFVPGTPPGHPTAKFLCVISLYRFFVFILQHSATVIIWQLLACDCCSWWSLWVQTIPSRWWPRGEVVNFARLLPLRDLRGLNRDAWKS